MLHGDDLIRILELEKKVEVLEHQTHLNNEQIIKLVELGSLLEKWQKQDRRTVPR